MSSTDLIHKAIKKYGTPLYIFDQDILTKRIQFLQDSLPSHVHLCYAAKANSFVLPMIKPLIDHYEICSPGEFKICKKLNIQNKNIVLSGVFKDPKDLEKLFLSSEELPIITIESVNQFLNVNLLAEQTNKKVKILLRLTSGNQFGLDWKELEHFISQRDSYPFLKFIGIQFFSGTQKFSQKKILREFNYLEEILEKLKNLNYKPSILEYGPGLPVDYFNTMSYEEKEHLTFFSDQLLRFKELTIILEIGRGIVAHCGSYATQVVDKKINEGQNYVIVDGGIHHIVYYGQGMAMKLPPFTFTSSNKLAKKGLWNICGALCTVNDILMKQVMLPEPELGDYFIFKNAGAYCSTEGISLFLTRDLPAVCAINKNNITILRNHTSIVNLNTPNTLEKGE